MKTIETKINKKSIMSPSKMIIWGFNLIVGYTILMTFSGVFKQVGNIMPVVILLGSLLSFVSGYAFGRMSQYFNKNGGVLLYTRAAFGRNIGGVFGFFQMMQLPIASTTVATGIAWAFTGINNDLATRWYILLFAIILFFLISIIPKYNFFANIFSLWIFWSLKWFIIIGSIIFALVQLSHFSHNIVHNGYINSPKNYFDFVSGTIAFFFAFGGFEAVASMTDDLDNSKRNMVKVLLLIVLLVCIFYLFLYFVIIGSLGVNLTQNKVYTGLPVYIDGEYNPINGIIANIFFKHNYSKLAFSTGSVASIIIIILLFTQIANKSASRLQYAWANTRIISAYASCGYLPESFTLKNKYSQFVKAFWLDYFIASIFSIFFIVLKLFGSINFLYSGILGVVAYISFIQSLGVLSSILWIQYKKKTFKNINVLKVNFGMNILFFIILLFIFTLMTSYIVGGVVSFFEYISSKGTKGDLTIWVSAATLLFMFFVSLTIIFCSNKYGWNKNAKTLSELEIENKVNKIIKRNF